MLSESLNTSFPSFLPLKEFDSMHFIVFEIFVRSIPQLIAVVALGLLVFVLQERRLRLMLPLKRWKLNTQRSIVQY